MKSVFVFFSVTLCAVSLALAQASPTATETGATATTSTTATGSKDAAAGAATAPTAPARSKATAAGTASGNETTGTIVEFTPGGNIVLNTGGAEPARFKLGKNVTYTNPRGKAIGPNKMKKDRKVRVHYSKQGADMVVDQVTIVRDKPRK